MTQTRPKAVAFDLDGTLIDSALDIQAAINAALQEFGAQSISLPETVSFIGNGIPRLCQLAAEYRELGADQVAPLTEAMLRHYMASPSALTRPYEGVVDLLEDLRAKGWKIGLCTNKALAPTEAILEQMDLARHFDVVFAGDSLAQKKPDPAPLHACFERLGGTPILYVGDSEVDAETALRAEIPFALFTAGYRKSPIEAIPHQIAFDSFAELSKEMNKF